MCLILALPLTPQPGAGPPRRATSKLPLQLVQVGWPGRAAAACLPGGRNQHPKFRATTKSSEPGAPGLKLVSLAGDSSASASSAQQTAAQLTLANQAD